MRNIHLLTFACVCALVGCSQKPAEQIDRRPLVRVGAATNGVAFVDALAVQGLVRAKNTAALAARVPGTLDALLVDEGATVKQGQPLFRIDQVNLAHAVRAAKDDLAMAKARLAQAEATEAKAKRDVARMTRLVKEEAVTKDMFEKAEVAHKSHAAAREAAQATLAKAETALAAAEKNFADSEVKAPFDGIITKKYKNAGDFCSPGAKVFDLEDTACYEVCVALNAALYPRVILGQTQLALSSQTFPLTYKSPSVSPLTRTFEVRAIVNKTADLAPGMLFDSHVIFARRTAQALPTSAVAHRGGGDCVFKVVAGKVVRQPVQAGLAYHGLREIVAPLLSPDDAIILEGMLLVNEGDEVRVTE